MVQELLASAGSANAVNVVFIWGTLERGLLPRCQEAKMPRCQDAKMPRCQEARGQDAEMSRG